ncbi:hypothetical protein [Catenulispora pinisilvae]|uniref:hypothetical protein n=1 Tax=Catenulispora pinisilvae TaxID=2705253 RepID=UPI0018920AD7|nr:hypothetical protein [Catenulispora pinisilvae]
MDARTRDAVAARDRAVSKVSHTTWRIGGFAALGAVALGAGFAHLLPSHLPHLNLGGTSGSSGGSNTSGDNGSSNSGNSGGIQSPNTVPQQGSGGGSHVTSGGS